MSSNLIYDLYNIANPTSFIINSVNNYNGDSFVIRDRTEKGWTLDFIFNTSGLTITSGNTFYYWGIENEFDPAKFIDNNLSFNFTPSNEIEWKKTVYNDFCDENPLIIEESDKTEPLCENGISGDFNVVIVFERDYEYSECCELENNGGVNDLFTGWTDSFLATGGTSEMDIVGGFGGWGGDDSAQLAMNHYINDETEKTTILTLNERWYKEKYKRLGTLKIYFNGNLLYKNSSWEEVIPTLRDSDYDIVQILGGGTTGSGGNHEGILSYIIKKVKYIEEPLNYIQIKKNYSLYKQMYNINECKDNCINLPFVPSPTMTPTPTMTPMPTPTPTLTPTITPTETTIPTPTPTATLVQNLTCTEKSTVIFESSIDNCYYFKIYNTNGESMGVRFHELFADCQMKTEGPWVESTYRIDIETNMSDMDTIANDCVTALENNNDWINNFDFTILNYGNGKLVFISNLPGNTTNIESFDHNDLHLVNNSIIVTTDNDGTASVPGTAEISRVIYSYPQEDSFFIIYNPNGLSFAVFVGEYTPMMGIDDPAWDDATYNLIIAYGGSGVNDQISLAAYVKTQIESDSNWINNMEITITDNLDGSLEFTNNNKGVCTNISAYDIGEPPTPNLSVMTIVEGVNPCPVEGSRCSLDGVGSSWPRYACMEDFIYPYPETDYNIFTLHEFTFNGVDYSNNETLRVGYGGEPVLWGVGLDGRTYPMNISDWLNSIAPEGIVFHDNMTVIDLLNKNSTYYIEISKGGQRYYYDNVNFFQIDEGTPDPYGTYSCQLIQGLTPDPTPTPTPTITPSTGSVAEVSKITFDLNQNRQFFVIYNPYGTSMAVAIFDSEDSYQYPSGGAFYNSTYQYYAKLENISSMTNVEIASGVKSLLENNGDWVVHMNITIEDNLDSSLTFTCNNPGPCNNIETYDSNQNIGGDLIGETIIDGI